MHCVTCSRTQTRRQRNALCLLDGDTIGSSNDNSGGEAAEKSMVHNADGVLDLLCHLHSILDGLLEVQVDDVVAIVGDGDLITVGDVGGGAAHSEDGLAALARGEGSDGAHGVLVAEGGDLHGDGEARAKAVGQLRLVN